MNVEFRAKSVVLTNGTFLNGLMHIGRTQLRGGRISGTGSHRTHRTTGFSGIKSERMKTGTPVRIDGRSVHFDEMGEQPRENDFHKFSYLNFQPRPLKQLSCWTTFTKRSLSRYFARRPPRLSVIQRTNSEYRTALLSQVSKRRSSLLPIKPASAILRTGRRNNTGILPERFLLLSPIRHPVACPASHPGIQGYSVFIVRDMQSNTIFLIRHSYIITWRQNKSATCSLPDRLTELPDMKKQVDKDSWLVSTPTSIVTAANRLS